jgi:hypothetical protein
METLQTTFKKKKFYLFYLKKFDNHYDHNNVSNHIFGIQNHFENILDPSKMK